MRVALILSLCFGKGALKNCTVRVCTVSINHVIVMLKIEANFFFLFYTAAIRGIMCRFQHHGFFANDLLKGTV